MFVNRRSIFKCLFAAPIAAAMPRLAMARSPGQELGDLAIQVSRLLSRANEYGDVALIEGAQRMFWGMPGLDPGLAKSAFVFYGKPVVIYDEMHEYEPVKAGAFSEMLTNFRADRS